MVLRGSESERAGAVAKREKRDFLAFENLFDHHFRAGRPEGAAEHHVDRRLRLGEARRDDDALAGGEPVGLDDDRRAFRPHIVLRAAAASAKRA